MIRSVFRVQCDGPCKGWLSRLRQVTQDELKADPYPGERAARIAARGAGWVPWRKSGTQTTWLCPNCKSNPLQIVLPPERAE